MLLLEFQSANSINCVMVAFHSLFILGLRRSLRKNDLSRRCCCSSFGHERLHQRASSLMCTCAPRSTPVCTQHMGAPCRVRQACTEDGATLDGILRYNSWLNERYSQALADHHAREWSVIVDAAGWHIGLFDSYAFKFLKRTATTDAAHYPELLHVMIIVNAPSVLALAWRVIRNWVDEETRRKFSVGDRVRCKTSATKCSRESRTAAGAFTFTTVCAGKQHISMISR